MPYNVAKRDDEWCVYETDEDGIVSVVRSQESVIGKQITLPEALCISRDISEQAERRRLLAAEWKAERGIQWKDLTYTSNTDGGWLTNEIAERRQ